MKLPLFTSVLKSVEKSINSIEIPLYFQDFNSHEKPYEYCFLIKFNFIKNIKFLRKKKKNTLLLIILGYIFFSCFFIFFKTSVLYLNIL